MSKYSNLVTSPLMEEIENYIACHGLKPGSPLPPEREFCRTLNVSRVALRRAISKLCEFGLLTNIQGKGTYVASPRIERTLTELNIPAQDSYKLISLQKIRAGSSVSSRLQISSQSEVYQIKRLRLTRDERISFETSYLPVSKLKTLDLIMLEKKPLSAIYNPRERKQLSQASVHISIGNANFEESEWLGIPEGDYVVVEKHSIFLGSTPAEYYISVSSAYRVRFSARLLEN